MKAMKKIIIKKRWRVMKPCRLPSFLLFIVFTVSLANSGHAQILDHKISIDLQNIPFEKALMEVAATAGIKFVYSGDQLSGEAPVTLRAEDKPLRTIFDELLTPRKIRYIVHEKEGSVTLRKDDSNKNYKQGGTINSGRTNSRLLITGTVNDATSLLPMAGVNVIVKGTTMGTTTDASGSYSIEADANEILVFSFIGYSSIEVAIGTLSVIDVSLEEDIMSLKEVTINAGYYSTSKKAQTGNISKVEAEVFANQPLSNPLAALAGRVPGLEITQQTGVPGGAFKVRIRGQNSISNGNDPLYIIDGVPFTSTTMALPETSGSILQFGTNPLNALNPADIESIEVLKDADATAIYGSRGSNGVILITTKKGKSDATQVDVNFYHGVAEVTNTMDLLNRSQYLAMRNEAFRNDGLIPSAADARDLVVWDTTRSTDWQRKLLGGVAKITDAQVSVSGGSKNTQFIFSSGYHHETTVFPGNHGDKRISGRLTITNTSANQKLKTSASLGYTITNTDLLRKDLTSIALLLPPVAPRVKDDDGNLSWENWSNSYENPLAHTKRDYEARTANLTGNLSVAYLIMPNVELKATLGVTDIRMDAITTTPISAQAPDPGAQNYASFSNSSFQNWISEPQLRWTPLVGQSRFDVLVGATFLQQLNEGLAQTGYGFSSEALMKNITAASMRVAGTNYHSQYRYQAFFGRLNYTLHDKYFLNFTGRRDGSSRFGPGKQFAFFGAVGAAWLFTAEEFIKNSFSLLSHGKIKVSYGTTGNDQLGDYQYLNSYSSSAGQYQGITGLAPDRLSNPDFAWETNRKFEMGIELGFANDRIFFSGSYYDNRSSDQLVGYPLPATTGFGTIQANFPAMVKNTGIEMELNTINIKNTAFTWSTSFNISIPRNTLVSFPDLNSFGAYKDIYAVGKPLNIRKLYHYTGVDPLTGLYTVEDLNDDAELNIDDRQKIGFVGSDYFGGFQNTFDYKGVRVDFLFQFVKQTGFAAITNFGAPGNLSNLPDIIDQRWQAEGDRSRYQKYSTTTDAQSAYSNYITSNKSIVDASFIRLKNIVLSYQLPQRWLEKAHITNARIFIQGQNLLTITGYEGLDPETQFTQLPPLKVLTGGFHLTL
jgi:TonB-dependent starch-binding outer membrane protein SusC